MRQSILNRLRLLFAIVRHQRQWPMRILEQLRRFQAHWAERLCDQTFEGPFRSKPHILLAKLSLDRAVFS